MPLGLGVGRPGCAPAGHETRRHSHAGENAGQDQGETPGFFTMNLSAAWQFHPGWQLAAGVDNLFDTFYYEHLSKSVHASQAGLGYEQVGRIPEPGRAYWLSVSYRFASAGVL